MGCQGTGPHRRCRIVRSLTVLIDHRMRPQGAGAKVVEARAEGLPRFDAQTLLGIEASEVRPVPPRRWCSR